MNTTESPARGLGPVVVGTDGSEQATRAVLWAADEAVARDRPLTVLHATGVEHAGHLPFDGSSSVLGGAREILDDAMARVSQRHPDADARTWLSRDGATRSLVEAAGGDGTVVVGSRGRGGFSALLLGSVGLRTAARARGPVVVVRGAREMPPRGTVTAAVRDDGDLSALRHAAWTARAHGASLKVTSVWMFLQNVGSMATMFDDLGGIAEAEAEATARMVEPVREEFPELTVAVETVKASSAAGALIEAAGGSDLLVVGARRAAHAPGFPLGHVTHAVLHHAPCPVAVVPRG
ncbi:universal stress protein [Streptomyces griseoviridis]|uniref:Universal stress protein n=1 Tax=Streptomyces griseoviridis TaxID=45398 RepID=A0A3Q9KTI8_STRGD|nr:universal stress protein [Streptomyces griseoviridis]AZS84073.1 universal stress protein [Streptomyces griseoviridis]QCN89072.1 universal stress protein UspA [Streptomyces griseoviridis]